MRNSNDHLVNEINGIALIDKQAGVSSAAEVAALKRGLKVKRVGHAGTLDPFATGLLVCLVGAATRLSNYAMNGEKIYSGEFKLGLTTDSDDITGAIVEQRKVNVSAGAVLEAASKLIGEIMQLPPKVSALKIDGERAYELVRRNEEFTVEPRRVTVSEYKVELIADDVVRYYVRCSKGTYIRALARDLGVALGCGACVATLRREYVAPFNVNEAKKVSSIGVSDILPWWRLFPEVPKVSLSKPVVDAMRGGDQRGIRGLKIPEAVSQGVALYHDDGSPVGLLVYKDLDWRLGLHVG